MAKPSIWGKKFNRDDDFVAQKTMLVNGVTVFPGQPIDKTQFTTRRLRCLYDWRWIRADEVEISPAYPISAKAAGIGNAYAEISAAIDALPKKRGRPRRAAV